MGANAQTTVPTFTASQVLTADQMNQSARTGIPVFSSTVTRDAGFGGTGEKTLAEGQLCYVEGTGLQSYNGSSWVTWGAAPSSGLTLVKTQTIGTTVASVAVTGAFSATYDNYLITVDGGVASASININMTLGATTTGYYYSGFYVTYTSSTLNGEASANDSKWGRVAGGTTNSLNSLIHLFDPFAAKATHMQARGATSSTTGYHFQTAGFLNNTTSYTDFTLTCESGTITGGTIRVYGYQNS